MNPGFLETVSSHLQQAPAQALKMLQAENVQTEYKNTELQGFYLTALYRTDDMRCFARTFSRAIGHGLTIESLLGVPVFRSAMQDEKAAGDAGLLINHKDIQTRILSGL